MKINIQAEPSELVELLGQLSAPASTPVADVRNIVYGEMSHFLTDVERRVEQAYEVERRDVKEMVSKVYPEDISVGKHMITGYTVTNNSPIAGSIAWASVHIVYLGTDYTITDANTALKYAWFDQAVSATVMQTSNTKPVLTGNSCLIFINNSGTAVSVLEMSIPSVVTDGAIDSGAIIAGAVGSTQLGTGAVTSTKILAGNVDATALGANAVTSAKIFAGAVDATALGTGAVTSAKILAGNVDATALGTGAVTSAKILAGNVDATALGAGAVTSAKILAGNVDATALGALSVTTAKINTGAVGATQLGTAAVTAAKLSITQHVLY